MHTMLFVCCNDKVALKDVPQEYVVPIGQKMSALVDRLGGPSDIKVMDTGDIPRSIPIAPS
jgi:hypothetical protein